MEYKVSLHVEKRLRDTQRDKLCEVRDMDCSGAKGSQQPPEEAQKGTMAWPRPWSWTSSIHICEKKNFCCLTPPSWWHFLWQPQETNTLGCVLFLTEVRFEFFPELWIWVWGHIFKMLKSTSFSTFQPCTNVTFIFYLSLQDYLGRHFWAFLGFAELKKKS